VNQNAHRAGSPNATPRHPLDVHVHGQLARLTGGVSPVAMMLAWHDWWQHLLLSPGKCGELLTAAATGFVADAGQDRRFAAPAWRAWPFALYATGFMQVERFWQAAASGVSGVAPHHAAVVAFAARQLLDMWSPSNFLCTNPEVLQAAWTSGGASLAAGVRNWTLDLCRRLVPPDMAVPQASGLAHVPGQDVAVTPGAVVLRNDLIELIQYTPQTAAVYREPLLIVPSWIMKYYILDLSPENSLVRYMVGQGHTVFMLSWRNPEQGDRDLGMDDYLEHGVLTALRHASARCGNAPVHAAGYCLGGTLLAIAAAALGGGHAAVAPLASVTLLAAQTDFSEPGELGLFIDDSELAFLEALMAEQGYLSGDQMAATFQLLHARDLVWSRMMREYLLGRRSAPNDLMARNADSTRLPARMHSQYLRHLFLDNDLAAGRYLVNGRPVALSDIHTPLFVLGTERDHFSPWRSVYKIHLLCHAPTDFVLVAGGHNAGIVAAPGQAGRRFRHRQQAERQRGYDSPDEWLALAARSEGSWWPYWHQWLARHAQSPCVPPRMLDAGLVPAPGVYVRQG